MRLAAFILALTTLLACAVHAQQTPPTAQVQTPAAQAQPAAPSGKDAALLDYIRILGKEASDHRSFLERIYTHTTAIAAALIAVFAIALGFFGLRTLSNIRKEAAASANREIEAMVAKKSAELDEKSAELDRALDAERARLEEKMAGVSQYIYLAASDAGAGPLAWQGPTDGAPTPLGSNAPKHVLWVDDYPTNNIGPITVLSMNNFKIKEAESTDEAMKILRAKPDFYHLVISDIGRGEDEEAAQTLLRAMAAESVKVPVMIYASPRAVGLYGQDCEDLGAIKVIGDGPRELMKALSDFFTT